MVAGRIDAIVVGAGPNGLAAAIELARAGRSVRLYEAEETVGGATRSAESTLPGFIHDVCSAVHPLALASPFFRSLDWQSLDVGFVHPDVPLAHALAPGRSVLLERDVDATAAGLGPDGSAWRRLVGPLVAEWERLLPMVLGPLVRPPHHPLLAARFAVRALPSAVALARLAFREQPARALFAGLSAHSTLPLEAPVSASFGAVLGLLAHAVGWPIVRGGTGAIAAGLEAEARRLGVDIVVGSRVGDVDRLPPSHVVLLDLTPRQVLAIAGHRFPPRYRRALRRYRYGPGVFKVDWALAGPIPWRDHALGRAGTVHLGGSLREIAAGERAVAAGALADRPFVILVQPTLFDPARAPGGRHTAWAYCHVPNGSNADMAEAIESRIDAFAPGFRDLILARSTRSAAAMEAYDPNDVGGDINGGLQDWRQLFFRPVVRPDPYSTPDPRIFICSSSTPPGGGVHGMSGYHAARRALRRMDGRRTRRV